MADFFTNFFKNYYEAPVIFIWVLAFWLFTCSLLALIKRYNKKPKYSEVVGSLQSLADIAGFAAFIVTGLLMPIDAYVTYFGDRAMSPEPAEWGQMGDFFGGMLNPILAFASFIALLYTIRFQTDAQNKATVNSVNDRKLSYLIPEYNRRIDYFTNDLHLLDSLYSTEMNAFSTKKSLKEIFSNALNNCSSSAGAINLTDLIGKLEEMKLESTVFEAHTFSYLRKVIAFKIEAGNLAQLHAEILELTGCHAHGSEYLRKAARHLIVATVFSDLPKFSTSPVSLENMPKEFVAIVDEILKNFRLDVNSFKVANSNIG